MTDITTVNPTTGQVLSSYTIMNQMDVTQTIKVMSQAQHAWSLTTIVDRKQPMLNLARLLREDIELYAALITTEMGKPITQARAEIEKCARLCDFYAEESEHFLEPEIIQTKFYKSYRSFQPLGIIFAIMPWNFPFWQVMRFAVPNLMAGNAGLLKHAPNCTGVSLAIEQLFIKAKFPTNLFRSIVIDIELSPFIIHHPQIAGVTLTGSNRAGKIVAKEAGDALKKVVLELGGSDPYVILDDADLDYAAQQCITSRLNNCGQVCIAAKRIIVVETIREQFEELIIKEAKKYLMGKPCDPNTLLGPMARYDLRVTIHDQVQRSIAQGARCVLGGIIPQGEGYFYPATVLLNVLPNSPAFEEELFGPIICITPAKDEAHAIALANQTSFGLAGAIFTADLQKGEYIAQNLINAGTCAVNSYVVSNPRLPFGGIKQSGFGRELSKEGMREFVNVKTITVTDTKLP